MSTASSIRKTQATGKQGRRPGTRQRSFRMTSRVLDQLEGQARLHDLSSNALAQRLIDEGLKIAEHPQICFREGAAGRRAALAGTRLDIWQIVETLRANDNSIEEAAGYLDLPENKVQAAVRYYGEFQDEVDTFADRCKAIADKEEAAFQQQQRVLRQPARG